MKTVALLLTTLALLFAACSSAGSSAIPSQISPTIGTSPQISPTIGTFPLISPSSPPSPTPTSRTSPPAPAPSSPPAPRPSPPATVVTTPDQAARLVLATDPRFRGIAPFDPNLIGQAAWYRVSRTTDGFEVVIRIGWGDCPSGCIDEHTWTYGVTAGGAVELVGEQGPAVPPDVIGGTGGNPGDGQLGVSGRVTAGPTCPVVRNPPDPACADRPVAGAVLIVTDEAGREVTRGTSDANGDFAISLQPGHYVLTPQPVEGLMGTAQPIDFTIGDGGPAITFDIAYDTGIR